MAINPGLLKIIEYASHGRECTNTKPHPHHFLLPTFHMPKTPRTSIPRRTHVHVVSLMSFLSSFVSRCKSDEIADDAAYKQTAEIHVEIHVTNPKEEQRIRE
jgi:hypothetical protein